jgi:hypothetical protein
MLDSIIKRGVICETLFQQMTSILTKEQKERIEAKRQLALQRRNERQRLQNQNPSLSNVNSLSDKPSNSGEWHPPHNQPRHTPDTCIVKKDSYFFKTYTKQIQEKSKSNLRQLVLQRNTSLPTGEVITGSCKLLSKERFAVTVPYQEQLIDIFKSLDSKMYGKIVGFCWTLCREL